MKFVQPPFYVIVLAGYSGVHAGLAPTVKFRLLPACDFTQRGVATKATRPARDDARSCRLEKLDVYAFSPTIGLANIMLNAAESGLTL